MGESWWQARFQVRVDEWELVKPGKLPKNVLWLEQVSEVYAHCIVF